VTDTAETEAAEHEAAEAPETVSLTLAHPYTREEPGGPKTYLPGDSIEVDQNTARTLISSGYAAVDAEDHEAVAEALGVPVEQAPVLPPA